MAHPLLLLGRPARARVLRVASLAAALWAFATAAALAQGLPGFSVQEEQIPLGAARGACGSGAGGQVGSTQDDLRFSFPLFRSGAWSVGNGFGWNHLRLAYRGFDPCFDPLRVSDLWAVSYSLYLRVAEGGEEDGAWLVSVGAHRAAEGYPTDPDAVRYTAGATRTFKTDPATTWGVGAYFTYVLGAPRLLPGVTYLHRADPWEVDVRLPFIANLWYRTSDWIRVGAQTRLSGGRFALDRTSPDATELRYANATAGVALALGRPRGPQVEFGLGYTIYRLYEITAGDRTVTSLTLDNQPYALARLGFRF
jgi:hypothetical protein